MGEGLGVMEERELVTAVVVEEEDEGEEEDNGDDRDPLIGGQERGVTRSYTYCWRHVHIIFHHSRCSRCWWSQTQHPSNLRQLQD